MSTTLLRATGGRNRAGEVIVVSTIEFNPPGDEGMPYEYRAETAVFCDDELAAIVRRYNWADAAERAEAQHEAILVRALR